MFSPRLRRRRFSRRLGAAISCAAVALLVPFVPAVLGAQQAAVVTRVQQALHATQAIDAGPLPESQPLVLTLHFKQSPEQTAALDLLLSAQEDRSSASYHHWLTPAEFTDRFGATEQALAQLSAWLIARGLTVGPVSNTKTHVTITGTAAQIQSAFSVPVHRMSVNGSLYFGNVAEPTVPTQLADLIGSISGLDDLPSPWTSRILVNTGAGGPPALATTRAVEWSSASVPDQIHASSASSIPDENSWSTLAALVAANANESAVVTLSSSACLSDISPAESSDYRALLRQANAQGMTILSTSSCSAVESEQAAAAREQPGFPAALGEVTALTVAPATPLTAALTSAEARPVWQAAPGLPADALRHEPDLASDSAEALATTLRTLVQQTGQRLGNVNATLYALAKTPGLYTQPAASAKQPAAVTDAGTWEPASGLGKVDLATLLKVFPRATAPISTITGVQSSSYAVGYGDSFTLTAKVIPSSYGTMNPTGTVVFSASSQGTLGSSTIDGNGNATLIPDVLPVGTYAISAVYSGDGSYTGSASTIKATVTISPVNAKLTASIAPATDVPYGATATVTATVSLPGANAAPSGPVSAQIEGITGALYTATLSPNPGGNTATANIVVSIPSPGTYELDVTCQGTTNYQCQTPPRLPLKTVKGYTNTAISVVPAAPQAGQPITLTATVANAGNGSGIYVYNGSVSFYDSGKLLATSPVATNQATISLALSGNRTHTITAIYTGDSNWNTSTSGAVSVSPTILPDTLALASTVSGSNSLAGVNIIFTGTTTTTITYGTGPTGTITFFDTFNGAVVQLGNPATLVSNGPTASIGLFTTTGLLPGTHHIYAQYSGDDNYAAALSAVLVLSLSDFNVTMTPTSLSLSQGKSQQVTVFVGESGGFNGTVSLGCTPPSSSLSTCSFAPASVAGGGATTLTIATTAASSTSSASHSTSRAALWPAAGGASLAALLLVVLPNRRRSLPALLALLLAAGMVTGNLGCGLGVTDSAESNGGTGSGSSGSAASNGTPLGTQNFVITAAGSDGTNTIRHTYQYQVTVQ